jgi:hypothetical protein
MAVGALGILNWRHKNGAADFGRLPADYDTVDL